MQRALDFDSLDEREFWHHHKVAEYREVSYGLTKNPDAATSFKATAWMALHCMDVLDAAAAIMANRFGNALMSERARRGRDHTAPRNSHDVLLARFMGFLITPTADPADVARKAFDWLEEAKNR